MELTHDFTVPATVDDTWATFMDLHRVGSCFPGAVVTQASADGFSGTVKFRLGPIALQYAGSGSFLERDDAGHRAVIEAKGKDKRGNGTAGATVTIRLEPTEEGTHVDVRTDLSVTGKPAQFGRGVMQDVSDKLLQQFVACIERELQPEVAPEPVPATAAEPVSPAAVPAGPTAAAGAAEGGPTPALAPSPVTVSAPTSSPVPSAPRPLRAAPDPAGDSLDLGATVLPVLVRSSAPYAVTALLGLLVGWLLGRRRS